ncbi:MAG: TetR family transcriptional regulator [Novosphingobium sp.]
MKLIEGAREIIRDEGCAAVTAGRLARKVDLGRHIVHYYFGTIDQLLAEVIRFEGEILREHFTKALQNDQPLRALWDPSATAVAPQTFELIALAFRSEVIRAAVQQYTRLFRNMITAAVEAYLVSRGLSSNVSPVAIGLVVVSISQALAGDSAIGIQDGHAEVEQLVESWIRGFEQSGKWPGYD